MARVSIDDDIELRPEFDSLMNILGSRDAALGHLVRFWRLAQTYWGRNQLVPLWEIKTWKFEAIIESGWGIVREEGVYAIFSEEMFSWYQQVIEAAKKSAESRRKRSENKNSIERSNNESSTTVERTVNDRSTDGKPLTLSPSLALSKKERRRESEQTVTTESVDEPNNVAKLKRPTASPPPLHPLASFWNERAPQGLARVKALNPSGRRYRLCRNRWNENPNPDYWEQVFREIEKCPFLLGENQRRWKMDFDFLCQPDSADKILEGKYRTERGLEGDLFSFLDKYRQEEAEA